MSGSILTLQLSNPSQGNALTPEMLRSLRQAALDAGINDYVRVIVIRGAGDVFSSGYAFTSFPAGMDLHDPDDITQVAESFVSCPKPILAVLNGDAVGAALDLAFAADIRIARAGMRLGITPARFGLVYSWQGIQRVVATVGSSIARRLLLTSELVSSEQALEWGALHEVASTEQELHEAEDRWTRRLQASAPLSVAGTKHILGIVGTGPPSASESEVILAMRRQALDSADSTEALRAFQEGRRPEFKGC